MTPSTCKLSLRCPVAMGKKGILLWLGEFKREPFPKKNGRKKRGGIHWATGVRIQNLKQGIPADLLRSKKHISSQTPLDRVEPPGNRQVRSATQVASSGSRAFRKSASSCQTSSPPEGEAPFLRGEVRKKLNGGYVGLSPNFLVLSRE